MYRSTNRSANSLKRNPNQEQRLRTTGGFRYLERKPAVRYGSEFVERAKNIKSLLFRQFIYVKLRIVGEVCKNLLFTCKNAYKPQKNTKFICPLLDTEVSGSPIIQNGERCDRRRWRRKGAERVAAVDKIKDQRKPEDFIGHRNRKTGGRSNPRAGQ